MPCRLTLDAPLECTIRAAGTLDPRWSARLGGLRVRAAGRSFPVTELRGRLRDQAALFGVLTTLYDLGLPLLSVDCRAAPGPPAAGAGAPPGPRRLRASRMENEGP
jgi:hypothetical protein